MMSVVESMRVYVFSVSIGLCVCVCVAVCVRVRVCLCESPHDITMPLKLHRPGSGIRTFVGDSVPAV